MSASPRHGGQVAQDDRSPLPLRATAIVLSAWIVILLLLALVVVPLAFASCVPAAGG